MFQNFLFSQNLSKCSKKSCKTILVYLKNSKKNFCNIFGMFFRNLWENIFVFVIICSKFHNIFLRLFQNFLKFFQIIFKVIKEFIRIYQNLPWNHSKISRKILKNFFNGLSLKVVGNFCWNVPYISTKFFSLS